MEIQGDTCSNLPGNHLGWTLALLLLFGISFGYVEAAIVVYLRELYEPLVLQVDPQRESGKLFPLITLDQLEAAAGGYLGLLKVELVREGMTIVMLAALGLAVSWNFPSSLASFAIAFGVWDISYYAFLKALIGWPGSLLEWDLLFLIPVPWVGPVLAPVLVAIALVVAGTVLLWRESTARPVRFGWQNWLLMVLGGLIIVAAFCWDVRNVMAGGMPNPFPWSVFVIGEVVGLVAFCRALFR